MDETTAPLPRDADGFIETSASFGMTDMAVVRITYNTDPDGKWVDEDDNSNQTFHGPFASLDEAGEWMEAYPDGDKDVKDMDAFALNAVRPAAVDDSADPHDDDGNRITPPWTPEAAS